MSREIESELLTKCSQAIVVEILRVVAIESLLHPLIDLVRQAEGLPNNRAEELAICDSRKLQAVCESYCCNHRLEIGNIDG
jgi:hypothetical protein